LKLDFKSEQKKETN